MVRLAYISGLTFFVCLACTRRTGNEGIDIQWKDGQAIAITIPAGFTEGIPEDSVSHSLTVSLADKPNPAAIFGEFSAKDSQLLFTPLIPFTRGMRYDVRVRGVRVASFEIPENNADNAPNVLTIYPTADTLPENLLKVYLHFDRPMREGLSGKYIRLIKNQRDTIEGAFLYLQPELWNGERTILTLWLDPGRIKRDLQPNKHLGTPMQSSGHYQILVSHEWRDTRGNKLAKPYQKAFVTTGKDSLSPLPSQWTLATPAPGTKQPFQIDFKESLDHSLLQEVFMVRDSQGRKVYGLWKTLNHEKQCSFIPNTNWEAGTYKLLIETRLEDLAGNNLNRPFDRDMTRTSKQPTSSITELSFTIK